MLTAEQQQAARHADGNGIVGAVAGSGKSFTMVEYLRWLVTERGADPKRVIALMFNDSARKEFAGKLKAALHGRPAPEVMTFHSFGKRLAEHMEAAGFLPPASLVTEEWKILKIARNALNRANSVLPDIERIEIDNETLVEFMGIVDQIKAELAEQGNPEFAGFFAQWDRIYIEAFKHFEAERKRMRIRTFADLIYDPVMLMLKDERVAAWAANRYDRIVLDEYQDINKAQQVMMRIIAGTRAQVMAVGDEDQCIYVWRGSKPEYMTWQFERDFPGTRRHTLSRTFRYGPQLSLLASHLISNNRARADKICLSAEGTPNTEIALRFYHRADQSGRPVVEELQAWKERGRRYSEAAILVREYSQAIAIEMALLKAGIGYRLEGAPTAFDRRELLALRGYLQLCVPAGLGAIADEAKRAEMIKAMLTVPSLWLRTDEVERLVERMTAEPALMTHLLREFADRYDGNAYTKGGLQRAAARWLRLTRESPSASAAVLLRRVIDDTDLYRHFEKANPRAEVAAEKRRMCEEFVGLARAGGKGVTEFLSEIDDLAMLASVPGEDAVLMTSVHRSKGLDWPLVIVPGLEEGRFPSYIKEPSECVIEDERRLAYVALTRAKEMLVMVAPMDPGLVEWARKEKTGHPDPKRIKASRFLYEANISLCRRIGDRLARGVTVRDAPGKRFGSEVAERYLREIGHPEALEKRNNFALQTDGLATELPAFLVS